MKIRVELVKSPIGALPKHRKTVAALGLKKLHSVNEFEENDAIKGMIKQVSHLLKVTEIQ